MCVTIGKQKNPLQNFLIMSNLQPVWSSDNEKLVQFGSKVGVNKIRTKTCYVCFFKDPLNTRDQTPILELGEGIVYTLVKFKYQSCSSQNGRVFEKTKMISSVLFIK